MSFQVQETPSSRSHRGHCSLLLTMLTLAGFSLILPAELTGQIAGSVLDSSTMQPIANAHVTLQTTSERALTAPDGSFSLGNVTGSYLLIVAAFPGYYNTSLTVSTPAPAVQFLLDPVPIGSDPSYAFVDPTTCGTCHPDQFSQWSGSHMAQAGTNTWVYDVYNGTGSPGGSGGFVYTQNSVHFASNPSSECASCHQPEPWIKQPFSALESINNLSPAALRGVSCEVCHKVAHMDESKVNFPGIHPASVTFNLPSNPLLHQVEYGPLDDAEFSAQGFMQPSYQPQIPSALCAACHQDKNDPDGNGNFEEPNGVISEPTYLEWANSPYADVSSPLYQSCAGCHMPAYGATAACIFGPVNRDPSTIRNHDIDGTTPAFLEHAVDLTMNAQQTANSLAVTVSITNSHTGHSVPTGVTLRNMILLVQAWRVSDGQPLVFMGNQLVDDLGGVGNPNLGYFAGLPGKLYAKKNHDANGNGPTFYTDATGITYDTRIPALATDTTSYAFSLPAGTGAVAARARLIYRRAFRPFVDAKQWTTDGHGHPLEDLQAPYFGHLMAEAIWSSGGPGAVSSFGYGCANLVAGWQGLPAIGATGFRATLSGALPGAQELLLAGFSNTSYLGAALPFDLGPYGAPGCALLVAVDAFVPFQADPSGFSSMPLMLPFEPSLVGTTAYLQWAASDPANSFQWSLSSGLALTIQP